MEEVNVTLKKPSVIAYKAFKTLLMEGSNHRVIKFPTILTAVVFFSLFAFVCLRNSINYTEIA